MGRAVFSAGHDHDALLKMSEGIRPAIAALEFPEPMHERQITVGIGTAIRKPGETLKQLIQRADEVLYEAKETGRNQTIQAK